MKNYLLITCTLLSLFMLVSCSHKLKEVKFVPQIKENTILIAGDSSDFKDIVRNKIIEKYRPTCEIHVINIKDLSKVDAKLYDVVLIMDTCMAWSGFNPSLKSFLDNDDYLAKTVLSMTAADPDWTYSYKGVDAITSASRVETQETFFAQIDKEIIKILEKY